MPQKMLRYAEHNGMNAQSAPRGRPSFSRYCARLAPVFLSAVFIALSAWTWRKWPDLLVDFGRELYVPWQILEGKILYRDMAYLNGPLSPYVNALWFRLFGPSLTTLVTANLAIAGAVTAMIYSLVKQCCDRLTATCSCFAFFSVSAFAHLTFTGNYNFVCPYSHELTHGIALSILMVLLLAGTLKQRGIDRFVASGLCLGLIFLTKAEVFLAALAAALVTMVLFVVTEPTNLRRTALLICGFLFGALLPAAFFFGHLCRFLPAREALESIAGTWCNLHAAYGLGSAFYRESAGLSSPWRNIVTMGRVVFALLLLVGSIALTSIDTGKNTKRLLEISSAAVLLVLSLLIRKSPVPWLFLPEPLPVVTLLGGMFLFVYCIRHRHDGELLARLAPICLWAVFAFFLMGKILLNPKFHHFGFGLAMPASIFLIVLLTWFLPRSTSSLGGRQKLVRLLVMCFLVADLFYFLLQSNVAYSRKTYAVASGRDLILTYDPELDPRGPAVNQLLEFIRHTLPRHASFVVLPEGVMINYLSRRPNPTPYINFMPTELAAFGETQILRSIEAGPPDFIIYLEKDTTEYGVGRFGVDPSYGRLIWDWVSRNYTALPLDGEQALKQEGFEIRMLKRKTQEGS